jgi:hypothetical protein
MKKLVFVISLGLLLSACGKGKVGVSQHTNNSADQPTTKSGAGNNQKSNGAAKNQPSPLYFISFSIENNYSLRISGIGFLSTLAKISNAYVFHVPLVNDRPPQDNLVARVSGGVAHIKAIDNARESVSVTSTPDLNTFELFSSEGTIDSVSASEDLSWLSWIDSQGQVYLKLQGTQASPVKLPAFKAKKVQIISQAKRLLIVGTNLKTPTKPISEVLLFELSEFPKGLAEIPAVSASLSTRGKWLALSTGKTLTVQNMENPDLRFDVASVTRGQIYQMAWKDDNSLAYVTESQSGQGELRVADIQSQKSSIVSPIHLPGNVTLNGIVCPAWQDGTLYFGTYYQSHFSIFRANKKANQTWASRPFATPTQETEGYGCPVTNSGAAL